MSGSGERSVGKAGIVVAGLAAVAILLHLLRPVASVLLLAFAGVLFAVFIDAVATALVCRTRMPRGSAVAVVVVAVLAVPTLVGVAFGPGIAEQMTDLFRSLPETWAGVRLWLEGTRWGPGLLAWIPDFRESLSVWTPSMHGIAVFFGSVFRGVVAAFLVLVVGIYVALRPSLYVQAALTLVPGARRGRYREVGLAIRRALRRWLVGRLVAMALIGSVVAIGLSIIGVPFPLAFGLIAALLEFVPYIGPVAAAIPAALVALAQSPLRAAMTVALFVAVQALENCVVSPLVEHRAVHLGPAVLVATQVLMGVLFGGLGVLLATPIAVVAVVSVQMLYVQDVLGERTRVLGEV
ncbi:MAG: AI-2E family transporter [Candidatus Eisenbacteria bacterium]|nr:AI-2E family transporter [Candidatus Eisenbacteria bacterium]